MSLIWRVRNRLAARWEERDDFHGEFPFFDVLELLLERFTDISDVRFLQIGAADGKTEDPISPLLMEHGWRGTLVEPSPSSFRKLEASHGGRDNVRLERLLVSDTRTPASLPFYEVKDRYRSVSKWTDQCSSLDRRMVLDVLRYLAAAHPGIDLPPDPADAIEEVTLPAIHIADLIERLDPDRLDLLVVDTMGHDKRILEAFPFDRIRPTVIMFEHYLMSNRDRQALLAHIAGKGYALAKYAVDTIAVRTDKARRWTVDTW